MLTDLTNDFVRRQATWCAIVDNVNDIEQNPDATVDKCINRLNEIHGLALETVDAGMNYFDDAEFDESAPERRKAHLLRLYRIGTLIYELSKADQEEIHMYETLLEEYEDALQESKEDPNLFPLDEVPDKPEKPILSDIKEEYYTLFPDSNERTRQRDFEELNRAGFKIHYDRKYKAFLFEYDESTGNLMNIDLDDF
jgi:hypothetical protein